MPCHNNEHNTLNKNIKHYSNKIDNDDHDDGDQIKILCIAKCHIVLRLLRDRVQIV